MHYHEEAALSLRQLKNVPEAALIKAMVHSGTLGHLLNMDIPALVALGFTPAAARSLTHLDTSFGRREMDRLTGGGGRLITYDNPDYPRLLKQINDPPLCFYTLGDITCLKEICISVVGSRKPSENGENITRVISRDLAKCGITIVSGLAYGIDMCAHRGALEGNGSTAAVLGSGFNDIYPKSHRKYVDQICEKGCIITEYFLDEPPRGENFPRRNRIICGLSRGVIIAEAGEKSGTLISARLAGDYHRDLFAVPVSPLAVNTATNKLIKTTKAFLVENYLDVLAQYEDEIRDILSQEAQQPLEPEDDLHKRIYQDLALNPLTVDELMPRFNMDYPALASILMELELRDFIERKNDGKYGIKVK